jgi:hypothetical protein
MGKDQGRKLLRTPFRNYFVPPIILKNKVRCRKFLKFYPPPLVHVCFQPFSINLRLFQPFFSTHFIISVCFLFSDHTHLQQAVEHVRVQPRSGSAHEAAAAVRELARHGVELIVEEVRPVDGAQVNASVVEALEFHKLIIFKRLFNFS